MFPLSNEAWASPKLCPQGSAQSPCAAVRDKQLHACVQEVKQSFQESCEPVASRAVTKSSSCCFTEGHRALHTVTLPAGILSLGQAWMCAMTQHFLPHRDQLANPGPYMQPVLNFDTGLRKWSSVSRTPLTRSWPQGRAQFSARLGTSIA